MQSFRKFIEAFSREGRDEYVATYKVSGKTFVVWLRITSPGNARVTYLNSYGKGTGTFKEILPQFISDLKKINIVNIDYSTASDEKTQGRSRDRLFNYYRRLASNIEQEE